MLKETGDTSLRLGKIGEPLSQLLSSDVQRYIVTSSLSFNDPSCSQCAFYPIVVLIQSVLIMNLKR